MTSLSGCQWDNPETAAGHIYAENSTGEEHRLALVVAEQSEGTPTVEIRGWYRVPADHALEFDGVLEPDRRHVVRARLSDAPPEDRVTATIDRCPEGQRGQRVVTIDVQPDGLGVLPRDCETSYTQRELEYVSASEYRDGSLDSRLTSTTERE